MAASASGRRCPDSRSDLLPRLRSSIFNWIGIGPGGILREELTLCFNGSGPVVEWWRGQTAAPTVRPGRKVRTRQDTVVGNTHRPMIVRSGKVPQRVDRRLRSVRVKGCGKSAPPVATDGARQTPPRASASESSTRFGV